MHTEPSAILLISCPDQRGLVAAVTRFISERQGNILDLEQHVDAEENVFFMRVEWSLDGFRVAPERIEEEFAQVARPFHMRCELHFTSRPLRMAVMVTREAHCFFDILSRVQAGDWNVELPLILSNRADLEPLARRFDIPFHVFPVTPDTKREQEARQLALLREQRIDFVVLARYMQILSGDFIRHYPHRIINIHHSFLPAFAGAKPYHAAYARGVKIIGATSHYVTEDLDEGPIIEQDIVRVSHKDPVQELIRRGRDVEKVVLARAIAAHVERRVLPYSNRTVVFS